MDSSDKIEKLLEKIEPYMIIVIIASFIGVLGGTLGAFFIKTINVFIELRNTVLYIILLMPLIGLIVVYINKKYQMKENGLKLVNRAITKEKDISEKEIPTLFVATTLSQLAGASIGRMEAPLKMGGSLGTFIAKFFNLEKKARATIISCGVASLFSAVFGTPLTATIIAIELGISKKNKKLVYILPILLSSCFSRFICFAYGQNSFIDNMLYLHHADFTLKQILPIILIVAICLVFALVFNKLLEKTKKMFEKIKNEYLRIVIGSLIMVGCIYLLKSTIFCGNDTILVEKSLEGTSMGYIFIVKALLTALCLAIGFKGGNIGPAFICGGTLGILMATLMGLDPLIGAAIGAITLFGSVTGCLISTCVLGVEIFGFKSLIFFIIIAIALNYLIKQKKLEKQF